MFRSFSRFFRRGARASSVRRRFEPAWPLLGLALGVWSAACEDGPAQVFRPESTDVGRLSGPPQSTFGRRSLDEATGGDSEGRARFCDEVESSELVAELVTREMRPDESLGGLPLWTADGSPVSADELLGLPTEGGFCEPTREFADAFTWGPTNEIVLIFNADTRLVTDAIALPGYRGALSARYEEDGEAVDLVVRVRERVSLAGRELDEYASRAEQASRPNSWLNERNITQLYWAVRQTFFDQDPSDEADFNCVERRLCDVIYTSPDESTPQTTAIALRDSGVELDFSPDGQITAVVLSPVRIAPFEVAGNIGLLGGALGVGADAGAPPPPPLDEGVADAGAPLPPEGPPPTTPPPPAAAPAAAPGSFAPTFASGPLPSCVISLTEQLDWAGFLDRCIEQERTLQRADFDVYTQRDAVSASFNGMSLDFLRRTSERGVFTDGERPDPEDVLFSMSFTRTLPAAVAEFVPAQLAALYKPLLEAAVRGELSPTAPADHPVAAWSLSVPPLPTQPQRLGTLVYDSPAGPTAWLEDVQAELAALYASLTAEQRSTVSDRIFNPVFVREPFTHAVLSAISGGRVDEPGGLLQFRTTDEERFSIGYGHFIQDGVPYRVIAQYSLNFGAITALTVERGRDEVDEVLAALNAAIRPALGAPPSPYYELALSVAGSPYGLGGDGIELTGFDRRLDTVDVQLSVPGQEEPKALTVPGAVIDDNAGFLRQIRGERFEFVPAHLVRLLGKESAFDYRVDEAGSIVSITQYRFKGLVQPCPGLGIRYGQNVPGAVEAWRGAVGDVTYRDCELVFNYSEDGNVLTSVSSLASRTAITVIAGRAESASIWQ